MKDEDILRSDKKDSQLQEKDAPEDSTEMKEETTKSGSPMVVLKQLTVAAPAPTVTLKKGQDKAKELSIGFDKEFELTLG